MTCQPILLSPPHVDEHERHLLLQAFDSNWLAPLGPQVDAFEREFAACLGVADAAAVCSGTAALHLALSILGVGPGDEVLVPTFTFVASANPIRYLGARPVFVDSRFDDWGIDPVLVDEELRRLAARGTLPKAVVAVDPYGECADWPSLREICGKFNVPLVEDAAAALGSSQNGTAAGTFGSLGIISFNGNKIITTSGGGMLVSQRREWIAQARSLAAQAKDPTDPSTHLCVGYNYRMSNLLAAVGRAQLRKLGALVALRQQHHARYRSALAGVAGLRWMPVGRLEHWNSWLSCGVLDPQKAGIDCATLMQRFADANIEVRRLWRPLHTQPMFASCRRVGGGVAETLHNVGLCLPSGSNLSDDDLQRVIDVFYTACHGGRGGVRGKH